MDIQIIVAIDPGKKGGIATLKDGKITVSKMSLEYLRSLQLRKDALFIVEEQWGTGRRSDFAFGEHYGRLLEILQLCKDVHFISAVSWQRGLIRSGLSYEARKSALYKHAKATYPDIPCIKDTCDALLILQWYLKQKG